MHGPANFKVEVGFKISKTDASFSFHILSEYHQIPHFIITFTLTRYAIKSFVITAFSTELEWMPRYKETKTRKEGRRGEV